MVLIRFQSIMKLFIYLVFICQFSICVAAKFILPKLTYEIDNDKTSYFLTNMENNQSWCYDSIEVDIIIKQWHLEKDASIQLQTASKRAWKDLSERCAKIKYMKYAIYDREEFMASGLYFPNGDKIVNQLKYVNEANTGSVEHNLKSIIEENKYEAIVREYIPIKKQLETAKTDLEKQLAEEQLRLWKKQTKERVSKRTIYTPDAHKITISQTTSKGTYCITINNSDSVRFNFCNIGKTTQFDFVEVEKRKNRFIVHYSANINQCLSVNSKKTLVIKPCHNAQLWSLFRLSTQEHQGYEIRLENTNRCLSHSLEIEPCLDLKSNAKRNQIFRLETKEGKYNDKLGEILTKEGGY